ncbi:MAG TPA: peptidoglycan-binding protein [Polyangiaceae bacterium]|nr:peptidoglycan-binding protein [Polyangiaceae bacterium]
MPRALRVLLAPLDGSRPGSVVGASVAFEQLASKRSNAERNTPTSAKLTFIASCFENARDPDRQEREIGSLSGELTLGDAPDDLEFTLSADDNSALFADPPASDDSTPPPRALRLELSDDVFQLPDELAGEPARLFVPADLSDGARHLELFVELEIGGATEAARDINDVLDVPLVPRPRHLVRVVDEMREPLANVPAVFEGPGLSQNVTTDDDGLAALDDTGLDGVTFRIADDSDVRTTLKARWDKPRPGAAVREAPRTEAIFIDDALDPVDAPGSTLTTLSIQPNVALARLSGLFFDTNKSFLLPSAVPDLRRMKALYDEHTDSDLLIVGHTDTSGEPSINDPLSLERADSMAAFLKDDVDTWLKRYDDGVPEQRRWGPNEDLLMLQSLPDASQRSEDEDPVTFFQRTRGLTVDGIAGPETRQALIEEYMAEDETTLPDDVTITTHGCGEFFPLDSTGDDIDSDPKDGAHVAGDRRVELFFFEDAFGIQPPPPGKNSQKDSREYPEWRKRAALLLESELRFSDRSIRVRLQVGGAPIANEEYALDVDGRRLTVARTAADGLIEQRLPQGAKVATIRIARLDLVRNVQIEPAEEFPGVDRLEGAQIRLAQLGFLFDEPSGKLDADTKTALTAFRKSQGLSAEPLFDTDTQNALRDAYGS